MRLSIAPIQQQQTFNKVAFRWHSFIGSLQRFASVAPSNQNEHLPGRISPDFGRLQAAIHKRLRKGNSRRNAIDHW